MAQNFQSSFIPKGPMGEAGPEKKKTSFFGFLMFLVFLITMAAAVGIYFYKVSIKSSIEDMRMQLIQAGRSIDQKSIDSLVEFSDKLGVVRSILLKHQVVSGFMNSLASSTVRSVYFNEFRYDNLTDNSLTINLTGVADSYGAVALQQDIFSKNEYWKSVEVSNLKLASDGDIEFDMTVSVDSKIVSYNPYIPPSQNATSTSANPVSTNDNIGDIDDLNDLNDLNLEDFNL